MARLSARDGRRVGLGDVRARDIDPIAELGFDLVWLTAAWTIGSSSRRLARSSPTLRDRRAELLPDGTDDDIVGSPYAVSAYEPPDNLGGAAGLAKLRQRLGEAGIGLILDFVPNHTASEHLWVRRHPEWFVHADSGHRAVDPDGYFEVRSDGRHWIAHGRDPNFPPWTDTAQLDYRHPDVPRAMTQALKEVATRCDGVVCSMAMLVLDDVFRSTWSGRSIPPSVAEEASPFGEFWWHATRAVHEVYPKFLLIGEAYWDHEWRLQQLGFDFTYDKPLTDRLVAGDVPAVVARSVVADLVELVLEVDDLARELGECQRDEGLGGLGAQVGDGEPELPMLAHPQARHDPLVRDVARPGRGRLQADRVPQSERLVVGGTQQAAIEVAQFLVRRLVRFTPELDRGLRTRPVHLALVHEEHPRDGGFDERGGPLLVR